MDAVLDWLIERGMEPSTWRGIFALLISAGITVAPQYENVIIAVFMAIIGLINVIRKQKPTIVQNTTIINNPKG